MEAGFIALLLSWCPTAVSSILIFLVSYQIKKSKDDSKENAERAAKLRDDIYKSLNIYIDRLTRVEHEYVKTETFLTELSGWRSEINRLYDLYNTQSSSFTQSIIKILTQGRT